MREEVSPPAVSVIVPLFNEEENVPILQEELVAALAGVRHEIIFVDIIFSYSGADSQCTACFFFL